MYPLSFPLGVLRSGGAKRDDWVLDPFCGRGTTNFAARVLGIRSAGIDSSPVAVALAKAKVASATAEEVRACATAILRRESDDIPEGDFWNLAFHKKTLRQLTQLRQSLMANCRSPARILLRAIVMGGLHGPRTKGLPSYFSNQSPRTFAPKPRYAVKFWREHRMEPPEVDVIDLVWRRANRYLAAGPPDVEGWIRLADSRDPKSMKGLPRADWVITSPPYFGMRTYIPDQWLRSWFLGGPSEVAYRQPRSQFEHGGPSIFAAQMRTVWSNVLRLASQRAKMVVRFGGIHDRRTEPMEIFRDSIVDSGWRITTVRRLAAPETWRRQSAQFSAS